jgi:hypothetical protein
MDKSLDEVTDNTRPTEDHLKLIFELQGELDDQNFRMEMLDKNVNMFLDTFSSPQQRQHAHEMSNWTFITLEWPIPLQRFQMENQFEDLVSHSVK